MFKVECPGCRAPYQVDERRIPSTGLKMRCPKCGTSFQVDPPADPRRTGPSPVLGAGVARPAAPARALGKGTMIGVAPAGTGRVEPPVAAPTAPPSPAAGDDYGEADLPTIGEPKAPPAAKPPIPRAPVPRPGGLPPRPAPPGPPPPRAATPPVPPRAAGPAALELDAPDDLPVPVAPKQAVPTQRTATPNTFELDDLDLPAPRMPQPAKAPPAPAAMAAFDLDLPPPDEEPALPALPQRAPRTGSSFDVPAVGAKHPDSSSFADLDLPSPRPPEQSLDLPDIPRQRSLGASFGEVDLPLAMGELELPSPAARAQRAQADLPAPSRADLPAASQGNLPATARGFDIPAASSRGFDLPTMASAGVSVRQPGFPGAAAAIPVASRPGGRSVFDLEPPPEDDFTLEPPQVASAPERAPSQRPPQVGERFGEIDIAGGDTDFSAPLPVPPVEDPFDAGLPPPASLPASSRRNRELAPTMQAGGEVTRAAGGGTNYGEVNLDGAEDEVPIEPPAPAASSRRHPRPEEEMEFGGVPQEALAPAARGAQTAPMASVPPRRKRLFVRVFAALFVVAVGGAAFALVPEIGPFGAYWLSDRLKGDEYARLLSRTVEASRAALGRDTALDAQAAARTAEAAQKSAKRIPSLKAYAAFVGYARELRFGVDAPVRARAKVLLDELSEEESAPYLALARAARAAAEGEAARARSMVQALERTNPRDPDLLVLKGELLLREGDAKAVSAWEAASKVEATARTSYGLARARHAAGDAKGAKASAQEALAKNPEHVGAKILLARLLSSSRAEEAQATKHLESIVAAPTRASTHEVVAAQTLLGDIHLSRSRISLAEAAYGNALKMDPKAARALTGLGEATFRAGRFSEALARFEAATQADAKDVDATIGVAKSKLLLERPDDALQTLKKLSAASPGSARVAYWYGRALEALGAREQALGVYEAALKQAPKDASLVDVYVALALLQNQLGQPDKARRTLAAASSALPGSPAIHRALGELALTEGRYDAAQSEFEQALAMDAEDLGARFKLGVTQRRQGKFDDASKTFDAVAKVDREYPGLALERGLLFEATGRAEEALKAYEAALAKAPNDPDLTLRVGCGNVAAMRGKEAEVLLRKVMALRPNSAETNHCLGRALLIQGRLADSQRLLDRAVELDGNRADYHLYMGWAASDAGDLVKAERALNQALKLDQALADAYWQRGVLRSRQGAVKDAITDLRKALELRPSRKEVHAALASALYDLGKEREALSEWQLAVEAQPDNAQWRFRYGRLLVQNQMLEQGREQLTQAIAAAEKETPAPRWLWEAHQMMARALGDQPKAVEHWEAFLRLGPQNSPYRGEAKTALQRLGRPWAGP